MTRRFGEDKARAILETHEIQGSNSSDKDGTTQSPDEAAMDRHHNEIGIKLGKDAKTFDDVVKGAQRTIDDSRDGDNPNGNGATWLPRDQWKKHPEDGHGQDLPEDRWNWGDKVDWDGKAIKEPYQYPHGGEEHRHQGFDPKGDVKFPETDGVLDSLGQSSDAGPGSSGQAPTSANPPTEQQRATNQEPQAAFEWEQNKSKSPADPQVAAMVEMASKPVDNPGRAALLKPVETLTQPEMMDMINHAQGDYRGWRSGDPLKYHTYEKVQDWHAAMYGDGQQQYDGGKPIEPQPIRPIPEQPSPHTTPNGEDLWHATARLGPTKVEEGLALGRFNRVALPALASARNRGLLVPR